MKAKHKEELKRAQEQMLSMCPEHPQHPLIARVNYSHGDWGHYLVAWNNGQQPIIAQFLDAGKGKIGSALEALEDALEFATQMREGKIGSSDPRLCSLEDLLKPKYYHVFWCRQDYELAETQSKPYLYRVDCGWRMEWRTSSELVTETFSDQMFGNPKASLIIARALFPQYVEGRSIKKTTKLVNGGKRAKNKSYDRKIHSEYKIHQVNHNGEPYGFNAYVGKQNKKNETPKYQVKFFRIDNYGGIEQAKKAASVWREENGGLIKSPNRKLKPKPQNTKKQ